MDLTKECFVPNANAKETLHLQMNKDTAEALIRNLQTTISLYVGDFYFSIGGFTNDISNDQAHLRPWSAAKWRSGAASC